MPSNYPAPPQYAKPAKIPGPFKGVITGAGHSSIYLTPVQEERIINWRETSTSSQPSQPKVKSAPASVRLPSNSSCTCTYTDCQEGPSAITSCNCSLFTKISNPLQVEEGQGPKFSCEKLLLEEHSPLLLQHDIHVTNYDDSHAQDITGGEAATES